VRKIPITPRACTRSHFWLHMMRGPCPGRTPLSAALEIHEKVLGEGHPKSVADLYHLSALYVEKW